MAELSDDVVGNILRINNALERIPKNLEGQELALKNLQRDLDTAKEEVNRPFPQEAELVRPSFFLTVFPPFAGFFPCRRPPARVDCSLSTPDG